MKQEILTRFPWPWMPSAALVIFFLFFSLVVVRLMRKSRHAQVVELQAAAQLALEEGEPHV